MKEFYKICLRHAGKNDNTILFWGSNNAGYYRSIEDAGLYEKSDTDKQTEIYRGDFLIHKDIIDKHKQKIVLPVYGDRKESYAGRNEFFVLPNTGQVRKELGITKLNFELDEDRNSFEAYFTNTMSESFKYSYSKTHFVVKGKQECFDEWWYCDTEVESDNRNKAIYEVFSSGDFGINHYDMSFIEFKKMVTCCRAKTKVLDKWVSHER